MILSLSRCRPHVKSAGHSHPIKPHFKSKLNSISCRVRNIQRHILNFAPHEFSLAEAAKRFADEDKKRFFAPNPLNMKALAIPESPENPLKKLLLPIFGVNADIESTPYHADYVVNRTRFVADSDGKIKKEVYTDRYHISGKLGSHRYHQEQPSMSIYAGLTYEDAAVEEALENYKLSHRLQPFDIKNIEPDTCVDPFVIRSARAQEIAQERINSFEISRVHQDIRQRVYCDLIIVQKLNINYNLQLSYHLLPGYVLKYPNQPARIMPAFKDKFRIVGPGALSIPKCVAVAVTIASIAATLVPQVAFTLRLTGVIAATVLSGVGAQQKLYLQNNFQQHRIKKARENNESVAEMLTDRKRREATENSRQSSDSSFTADFSAPADHDLAEHLARLDLNPRMPFQSITEEIVQKAWLIKIKKVHTDTHKPGSNLEETQKVNISRDYLKNRLKNKKDPYTQQKRYYSTSRTIKQPPRSIYHPKASVLIDAVLIEKNYGKALQMIEREDRTRLLNEPTNKSLPPKT